ncbi:hypothetical protein BH09ACT10_BH09ACT10_23510 [soil metagenome]
MAIEIWSVPGVGEVNAGDDLATLVAEHAGDTLRDGDVVVVTSKIVSKAAGLSTTMDRAALIDKQTDRVVATRGETKIVRTYHGLTLAAAGIDASNAEPGRVLWLPDDPDADARAIRHGLRDALDVNVAVVITDTAGRAWRIGQTDIAIGCAGIVPVESFAGAVDSYGNPLVVTAPAIADEIAGAAELAAGKLDGTPIAIVRGLRAVWFSDDDGPGAAALIREENADMFGLGAKDAVLTAAQRRPDVRGFPEAEPDAWQRLLVSAQVGIEPSLATAARTGSRIRVTAHLENRSSWLAAGALAARLKFLAIGLGLDATIEV